MSHPINDVFLKSLTRYRAIGAGQYLFHRGDTVENLFFIEEGEVHLIRHQADGKALTLQHAFKGDILAEASVFTENYHCDAIARVNSKIAAISKRQFMEQFTGNSDFAFAFTKALASKVQSARLRGEILTANKVSERLDAWLDWHGALPEKGQWKDLAQSLAVSPEALYREIARRR